MSGDTGSGPNEKRQEAPHPHSVVFDPSGHFVAAADLGVDKVEIFRLSDGGLARVSEAPVAPGAGPRHIAFDLGSKRLYVLNELTDLRRLERVEQGKWLTSLDPTLEGLHYNGESWAV